MDKEEIKIKEFDKEQLELLLKDLQDIDKFTGFKDGAFKYELGKYQANLLVNCIKKQKEVIDDCKEDISNLLDIINKNCNELKCTSDEWLVIQKYQDKEVSEWLSLIKMNF